MPLTALDPLIAARVPTEVIKSRLQTKEFIGPIQAVRNNLSLSYVCCRSCGGF